MDKTDNKKNSVLEVIMGLGLITTLFLAGSYKVIGFIGVGIIFIALLLNLGLRKIKIYKKTQKIILFNIVYMTFHFIIFACLDKLYSQSLYNYLQQICIYIFLFILIGNEITKDGTKNISRVFIICFAVIIIYIFFNGIKLLGQSTFFNTQLGMCALPALAYMILTIKNNRIRYFSFLLFGIIIYLSDARSALGGMIIFLLTYVFWNKIKNNKKNARIFFVVFIIICLLIPIIYVQLSDPSNSVGLYLNRLTIKYTGGRLFSGRDVFWPYILENIKTAPIFGSGIGISVSNIYDTTVSTHNLFLFIMMQTGGVGLALFIYMLYSIWDEYIDSDEEETKIFAGFMLAILLQQTFSLGLLSGKMALAIPSWTVIALGITYTNKKIEGEQDVRDFKTSI